MDGYVNNITLVQNEVSKKLKPLAICPLCENILIDPMMCKCQKVYCKACIDEWSKKHKKCPSGCKNPKYEKCIQKYEILSKLKFRCLECEEEILYNNAESHHKVCCPDKKISKIKNIEQKKIEKIAKKHSDSIRRFRSKKKYY